MNGINGMLSVHYSVTIDLCIQAEITVLTRTLYPHLLGPTKINLHFASVAEPEPPGTASFEAAPEPGPIFW